MSKRIVFLADCLVTQKAGIHFYAKQFIRRTIAQYPNNQYFTILPHPSPKPDTKEIIIPIKRWIPLHYRVRYFTSIPKAVKELNPDLVIEMAHFGPFRLPNNIRRATVIHDLTPIIFPEWHDKLSTLMHKMLLPSVLKKVDNIITNSIQTKNDVVRYMPAVKDKISVAYPQVISKTDKSNKLRNNSEENTKYLLAVGTIEPRKNYVLLLNAFTKLAETHPDIELKIVGYKGWKSNDFFELLEHSKIKKRIILEGYTTEERLGELYKNAFAFVFPSLYEGFGIPLLEAMSYSLPIVCSNLETSKEICADAAFYFSKNNDEELVETITLMLENSNIRRDLQLKSLERFKIFNTQRLALDKIFE